MTTERPQLVQKALKDVMARVAEGKLHAARPVHVYPVSELESAFRFMQGGKSTGKIVIEMKENSPVMTVLDPRVAYSLSTNATYLICGGLGGLGRSIARWMVGKGAKNLILLSRTGPKRPAAVMLIEELEAQGVHVEAPACDVTDLSSLDHLLQKVARSMPPIRGCVQSAMIVKDAVFQNMSFEDWNAGVNPKVRGSWNLRTRLPKGMDFFILLSSVSGILGSAGQSNYCAANSYLDALAHYRIAQGEKAVAFDLGVMGEAGYLAENKEIMQKWMSASFMFQVSQKELFALLEYHCNPDLGLLPSVRCQMTIGIPTPARIRAKGIDEPKWLSRPLFRHLHQADGLDITASNSPDQVNYAALLASAASMTEASSIVAQALLHKLSRSLSIGEEDMDVSKPLHTYGVDSLVTVELRNWFAKQFGADLAIFDILGEASISAVGASVAAKSSFFQAG